MVIAGPGTGKTQILTLRIANILKKTDTPAEAILALTYTTNGAAEMQQRLAQLIGSSAYQATITTFHGLCEQIIRDHEEHFTDLAARRVADDADRRRVMEKLFEHAPYLKLLASFGDDPYYVGPALNAIEDLKREGVAPDAVPAHIASERERIVDDPENISSRGPTKGQVKAEAKKKLERLDRLQELVPLYRDYETALAEAGLYDYNDMLTKVRDALEANELLRLSLQEKYQYILVDEHQDTNSAQNRIIELLASYFDRPNLFIVGDEKQAIYRFQGASLDNFLYFKDRFKDVRLIALADNYRSSQMILDAAHAVRASREPLIANAGHPPAPIMLYPASHPDAQYYAVGRMIRERLDAGVAPDEIAVLYRKNADGQELAGMLAHMGIPYSIRASFDVLEDPDIRRLFLILEAVRDYGAPGPLYEALHVPWLGIPPLDLYKLNAYCSRDRNSYDVIASPTLMGDAHLAEVEALKALSGRLAGWHALARQDDPARTLETIIQESGCLAAMLAHPEGQQKLARLHAVYDVAKELAHANRRATLLELVDRLRYVRDKGIRLTASAAPIPNRIQMMTAHGAKGLEFDSVFIIDCYDKHWPARGITSPLALPASVFKLRAMDSAPGGEAEEDDAQERNLFFVALTRARREVIITWPARDRQGKELVPSRYVGLITPALAAAVDTAPHEADFEANRHIRFASIPNATPELADHAHLKERFLKQGLSATGLNNYLECPWKYFYRNLVRIPEAPSVPMMYGNAVDRALQRFFNCRGAEGQADAALLLDYFRQAVREEAFTERDLATALERGESSLAGWYQKHHASWPVRSIQQQRISGIPVPGVEGATMNGKLDKIEFLDDTGLVRVVDFKTGKPKPKNDDYRRQLVFYKVLLDRWKDGAYRMHEAALDFIDPDDKGSYRQVPMAITASDADALIADITRISDEILNLKFWNETCDQSDCHYCQLRHMMKI